MRIVVVAQTTRRKKKRNENSIKFSFSRKKKCLGVCVFECVCAAISEESPETGLCKGRSAQEFLRSSAYPAKPSEKKKTRSPTTQGLRFVLKQERERALGRAKRQSRRNESAQQARSPRTVSYHRDGTGVGAPGSRACAKKTKRRKDPPLWIIEPSPEEVPRKERAEYIPE